MYVNCTHLLDKPQRSFKAVVVLEVFGDFYGSIFLSIGLWVVSSILTRAVFSGGKYSLVCGCSHEQQHFPN